MTDELLEAVKRKLNITWSDDETDARVKDIYDSAVPVIRHKIGLPDTYTFEEVGQERMLLLSYCLYEWNHVANEFDNNYANEILQLRKKWEVKDFQETETADATQYV